MNDGKIVLEWTHEEVKYSPMIKDIYFGKDRVMKHDGLLERAELVKNDK
jgi:hypothetical protein